MIVALPPLRHVPSCHVGGNIFCQVVVIILTIELFAYLYNFICIIHKDLLQCPYELRNKQLLLNLTRFRYSFFFMDTDCVFRGVGNEFIYNLLCSSLSLNYNL